MNDDSGRVFYLVPLHHGDDGSTLLSFPSDASEVSQSEDASTLGYGIFAFVRHERNRGTTRVLSFPTVLGFGDNALEMNLTLHSDFPRTGNSNRFVCNSQFGEIFFSARKFPPNFRLAGKAKRLADYNVWALIPESHEELEFFWREHGFYLLGYGK